MSADVFGFAVIERIHRVIDGDTLIVSMAQGSRAPIGPQTQWLRVVTHRIPVRLSGIDAPEINTDDLDEQDKGYAARDRLLDLVNSGDEYILTRIQRDKFFRLNGLLFVNGHNINLKLLDEGLVRPYGNSLRQISGELYTSAQMSGPNT